MKFDHPSWRSRPVSTGLRVAKSLVRRALPPFKRPVVAHDGGRSRLRADLGTALGLTLYRYGIDEPGMALCRAVLAPGDVFVDGGANVGLYALVGAAAVGAAGRVVAFEPAEATRAALVENVCASGMSWIDVRPEALDLESSEREMVTFGGDGAGLSSFEPAGRRGGHRERVRTVRLDEALALFDASRLTLVKLDLEGAERRALAGARSTLESVGPDLLVEVEPAHLERQGASSVELLAYLGSLGYSPYALGGAGGAAFLEPLVGDAPPAGRPNVYFTRDPSRVRAAGLLAG